MRQKTTIALAILFLAITPGVSSAQRLQPSRAFVFNIDYARFQYSATESYLEVYYAFYPGSVVFELREKAYFGAVLIRTILKNTTTGEFVVDQAFLLPVTVQDTSGESFNKTFVTHTGYAVPHGPYLLEVFAEDTSAPGRGTTLQYAMELRPHDGPMAVSDVELCSNIANSTNTLDLFYKNSLEVVPNPTQVFGVANHPVLFYYLEFYNIRTDEPLVIRAEIRDAQGGVIRESSKNKTFKVASAVEAGMMNVSSLESGKYVLGISVREESEKEITRREKPFFVYNPHIKSSAPTVSELIASDLAGLTEDELDKEFGEAQYVAIGGDISFYGELNTIEAKRQFLAKFWEEVEGGKPGKIIIKRQDYLRRVETANQRFRVFNRPGWKTDRGRVHILYAEPDQIDRVPSSEGGKPHEVWYYYQIENGVQFVFIDRTGFGEYVLVHSTKRGELQDENWTRLLQ